jgi:hypothetical protein
MHGKTHTENGEEFTDSHMIEFQEPPLVPIQTNSDIKGLPSGPVDVEAEMLRLKNEPYKRRRSRKAYEKVDILVPLDDPSACHLCGECFDDRRSLVVHLRIHELASQYMPGGVGGYNTIVPTRCALCDYATKSYDDMLAHMEVAHNLVPKEEKENRPQSSSPADRPHDRRSTDSTVSEKRSPAPIHVKEEPQDGDSEARDSPSHSVDAAAADDDYSEETRTERETVVAEDTDREHSPSDDCRQKENLSEKSRQRKKSQEEDGEFDEGDNVSENLSVTQSRSDSVRVKSEPESDNEEDDHDNNNNDDDSSNDPPLPVTFLAPPPIDSDSQIQSTVGSQSSSPHQASPPPSQEDEENEDEKITSSSPTESSPSVIVQPAADVKLEEPEPPTTPEPALSSNHNGKSPSSAKADALTPHLFLGASGRAVTLMAGRGLERNPTKSHCQICNITFQQEATLIAHKKYYCPARAAIPQSASA